MSTRGGAFEQISIKLKRPGSRQIRKSCKAFGVHTGFTTVAFAVPDSDLIQYDRDLL